MKFNVAKKMIKNLLLNQNSVFMNNKNKQQKILERFNEPSELLERSYYQYLCQATLTSLPIRIIQNIFAIFLLPYFYILLSLNRKDIPRVKGNIDAVFLPKDWSTTYIPEVLQKEFKRIVTCKNHDKYLLESDGKFITRKIFKRYWYRPYFCLKCMMKIALYAYQIKEHCPRAIITCSEYSFTSSVLTLYRNKRGIEHINIMHGEKLFNIRDSFVQFDRYYVWDQHYIYLLTELRAQKDQFRIEVPVAVNLDNESQSILKFDVTYYLGGENENDLKNIKKTLLNTEWPKEKICIRYHPRYSNKEQIHYIFDGFYIEDPAEVPLHTSVSQTKFVLSLYSTVLYQAYQNGKKIIIDDVTDPNKYENLKNLKYIMISKPHYLLSKINIKKC